MIRRTFLVAAAAAAACGGTSGSGVLLDDAGADATVDGGGLADAPSPGDAQPPLTDAGTPCVCPVQGETCCVYVSSGSIVQQTCAATCPGPDAGQKLSALQCSGSDCADAGVCCIWRSNNQNYSVCKAACNSANNEVQLCNASLADSGCAPTQPCSSTNITDWDLTLPYATCGGHGVP